MIGAALITHTKKPNWNRKYHKKSAQPATGIGKERRPRSDVSWPLTLNRRVCKSGKQRTRLVAERVLSSLCRDAQR